MKFSKVASIAFLALSTQAAIVQNNQEPTKVKKDVVVGGANGDGNGNILSQREYNYDVLAKDDEISTIISIITSALTDVLPELIKIISGLLGDGSSPSGAPGSLDLQKIIDDVIDAIKKILPQTVSAVQQSSSKVKRDAASDIIQEFINEGIKLTPEVIAFLEKIVPQIIGAIIKEAPQLIGGSS